MPKISRPRVDQPLGLVGRLDVLDHPRVGAVVLAGLRYSTIRSNARPRGAHPLHRADLGPRRVRIGLIFSAPPSQACALPMRPPRRRYSSVSTANQMRLRSARLGRARRPRPRRRPRAATAAARQHDAARARRRPCGVDDLDAPPRVRATACSRPPGARPRRSPRCRRRCGPRRCRGPRRAAARRRRGSRRSTAARSSAARRRAQLLVERVEVRACRPRARPGRRQWTYRLTWWMPWPRRAARGR